MIPLHGGADYVHNSEGLGDELGFIPSDNATLQSTVKPNIFVLGDAADVPTSKAGSVTHFEGEVLVENIDAFLRRARHGRARSTGTPTASSRPATRRRC